MLAEQLGVAREKADRVEARRHRRRAEAVDAAEGRPQAIEPAEGRRHADRAAGVAAEREVAEAATAAAEPQEEPPVTWRSRDIDRLAVMGVGAEHAVEELVADGDAGEEAPASSRRWMTRAVAGAPMASAY